MTLLFIEQATSLHQFPDANTVLSQYRIEVRHLARSTTISGTRLIYLTTKITHTIVNFKSWNTIHLFLYSFTYCNVYFQLLVEDIFCSVIGYCAGTDWYTSWRVIAAWTTISFGVVNIWVPENTFASCVMVTVIGKTTHNLLWLLTLY